MSGGNLVPLVFRSEASVIIIILTWCCTRTQDILPHSMTSMKSPEDTDWGRQTSFCTHLIAHEVPGIFVLRVSVLICVNFIVRDDAELTKSQIRTFFLQKIVTSCIYLQICGLYGICYSLLVALEWQSEGDIPIDEGCAVSGWTRTIISSSSLTPSPVYHLRWSTVLRFVLSYTIIALFLSDISKKLRSKQRSHFNTVVQYIVGGNVMSSKLDTDVVHTDITVHFFKYNFAIQKQNKRYLTWMKHYSKQNPIRWVCCFQADSFVVRSQAVKDKQNPTHTYHSYSMSPNT